MARSQDSLRDGTSGERKSNGTSADRNARIRAVRLREKGEREEEREKSGFHVTGSGTARSRVEKVALSGGDGTGEEAKL